MNRDKWEDYTLAFKPLFDVPTEPDATPMYSYNRVANMFWSALMNGLRDAGYSEKKAKEWLASKNTRWMLDGDMSDKIEALAYEYGKSQKKST